MCKFTLRSWPLRCVRVTLQQSSEKRKPVNETRENANMPEAKPPERKLIKVSLSLCCKTWKRMFLKRTVYFLKCTNGIPFYFNGYNFGLRFIILFPDNVPLLTPTRQLCDVT